MKATGYDRLSLIELDLIHREEFHNKPEEDCEQYLMDVERQEAKDREDDAAWMEYLREQEDFQNRLNHNIRVTRLIIDSILKWLSEGKKAA